MTESNDVKTVTREPEDLELDAVVVGAGFAGMYAVLRLRELGLTVRGIEAGSDVGGTWYWNRYPGCRCDIPSVEYSYGFDPELEQEWHFPESNASQADIERYLQHVADRFDLRPNFVFDTRVTAATYDDDTRRWVVTTDHGDRYVAKYCIMAMPPLRNDRLLRNVAGVPMGATSRETRGSHTLNR